MGKITKKRRRKNRTRTNFYKIRRAQNKNDPLTTKVSMERKIRARLSEIAPSVPRLQMGVIIVMREMLETHLNVAFRKAYLIGHEYGFKTIKKGSIRRHRQEI